ncbi:hypothetical protein C8R46DRAFT_1321667, partial [Mycena filopes]
QMFPPELVAIGYYTAENADTWIDIAKFMRWLGHQAQKSSATPPSSPVKRTPVPRALSKLPPSSVPPPTSSSPIQPPYRPSSPIHISDTDEDLPPFPLLAAKRKRKELRPEPNSSDSDSDRDFAYRVDLTADDREWLDGTNKPLSMAAIIKSEDQDSWGGGSAGSVALAKATKVVALDGVQCQVANHGCQGVYICDQLDPGLLDGHERYEPDDDDMRELFNAERTVNVRETSSMGMRAAAFYTEIHSKPCPHTANGVPCAGLPVYRPLRQVNLDGKNGFIGCQNYRAGTARTHRFISINRDVKEDLIRELLANNGRFTSDVHLDPETATCARVLHPRSGGKGDRLCPYTHIDEDQQVIKGKIIHRPCGATIRIFSPIDRTDRRAIVYFVGPHNHPRFPATKVSRAGKDAYRHAVDAAGVSGLTVLKLDSAASTSKLFDGRIPAQLDPALANARVKRGIIAKVKRNENPHGLGIEGVIHRQKQMQTLPPGKQYIWSVTSEHNEEMVITMLPYLANLIHSAKVSLHDNTYARVHGIWKEWEVVIWDTKFDMRCTIARIYSQHETYEVFKKMWPGLFDTIGRITESEVKFKFIDGEGLKAILVDGSKPQGNALGDYLVSRNRPHLSGIHEKNPKLILFHNIRTCITHLNRRKLTSMALIVPDEPMSRIRRCPYIKTQQEMDEFIQWCKDSEYKVVRDWIVDKASIPWFFPSVNEFLSKIPEEDWYLTPGDTNLNESAHPYTNQHTGTNLPLLEAIDRAYVMDLQVEAKHRAIGETCVLINHRNTKPQRDRNNVARRTAHLNQALQRSEARLELENLEDSIEQSAAAIKELRERRKALKLTAGIKKTK